MYTRFIHILLLTIATGWLFASCSSDDPSDETPQSGSEMQFATSGVSRASVSADLNYAGSQFAIFGDMKLAESSSSTPNIVFNGIPVSYNNSVWTYSGTQYWIPKHEYSFVAVHPASPAGATDIKYSNSRLQVSYELPAAFADTHDLVVATHRRTYEDQTSTATPPVMLHFTHILSRINFSLKNDNAAETVKVTKVELVGINRSGNFTITPASILPGSKQTDDFNCGWSAFADKITHAAGIEVEVPQDEVRPLFPDNNALLVIPQPDNDSIYVKISYTLIFSDGRAENKTLSSTTSTGGWQQGKVYNYSVTISPEIRDINMTVTVSDWKSGTDDDVTVPRK